MNVFTIKDQVLFFLDRNKSPRFSDPSIMSAILSAEMKLAEKYLSIQESIDRSADASMFASDEIASMVEIASTTPDRLVISGNKLISKSTFPSDYGYLFLMQVTIDDMEYWAKPIPYSKRSVLDSDYYSRPHIGENAHIYYSKYSQGIECFFGAVGTLQSVKMYYLKKAVKMTFGSEITEPSVPPGVVALDPTKEYYVQSTSAKIYNTASPSVFEMFYKTQSFINPVDNPALTAGTLSYNYGISIFPDVMLDELASLASQILLGTIQSFQREADIEAKQK